MQRLQLLFIHMNYVEMMLYKPYMKMQKENNWKKVHALQLHGMKNDNNSNIMGLR